jgi:hypothetical protein
MTGSPSSGGDPAAGASRCAPGRRGHLRAGSCRVPRPGYCVLGGQYLNQSDSYEASVSCTRAGACLAVGLYTARSGGTASFAVTESGDRWRQPVTVPVVPANADGFPRPALQSVTCSKPGTCLALGSYAARHGGRGQPQRSPAAVVRTTTPGLRCCSGRGYGAGRARPVRPRPQQRRLSGASRRRDDRDPLLDCPVQGRHQSRRRISPVLPARRAA